MFNRINNKILLAVFAVLILLVAVILIYDNKKGERTFKNILFTVDSAKITNITIYPKGKMKKEIKLLKNGSNWEVRYNNKSYPADTSSIKRILQSLSHIKTESVACNDKSCWQEYQITDTSSTHLIVEQDKEVVADLWLGKISFSQSKNMNYSRNNNSSIKSHIRIKDDNNVYVVDGFLSLMFSDQLSMYRNRILFQLDKNNLTKLTFTYPADSSFTLQKTGNKWLLNDKPADSAEVEKFFTSIEYTENSEFAEDNIQFPEFNFELKIEGSNMPVIVVKGAIDNTSQKYFVKSNFNTSAIFGSANSYFFNNIFKVRDNFDISKVKAKKEKEEHERKLREEKEKSKNNNKK